MSAATTWLEQRLWPRGERGDIWMVADCARDRRIFPMLLASHLEYSCLYSGDIAPALSMAAPYLVRLEFDQKETRRLLKAAWGNAWGIFLKCDNNMKAVRRHLREFLRVRGPANEILIFRYYDPRVLRVYLPTCQFEELRYVFGPVENYWTEDASAQNLVEFGFTKQRLVTELIGRPAMEKS